MIGMLLALPWRLYAWGGALLALLSLGLYAGHVYHERNTLLDKAAAQAEIEQLIKRSARADIAALTGRMVDRTRIVTITKEIIREVPSLVPAGTPDLPPGFRVLHDAAAQGVSPASRGADGSPVPAQDAAEAVADNYGTALDNASRLQRLQQWIADQSKGSP